MAVVVGCQFEGYRGGEAAIQVTPVPALEGRVLACPTCSIDLIPRQHPLAPGIEIDVCQQCDGIFLDAGEFAALRARSLTREEILTERTKRQRRNKRQVRMRESRTRTSVDSCDILLLGLLLDD